MSPPLSANQVEVTLSVSFIANKVLCAWTSERYVFLCHARDGKTELETRDFEIQTPIHKTKSTSCFLLVFKFKFLVKKLLYNFTINTNHNIKDHSSGFASDPLHFTLQLPVLQTWLLCWKKSACMLCTIPDIHFIPFIPRNILETEIVM